MNLNKLLFWVGSGILICVAISVYGRYQYSQGFKYRDLQAQAEASELLAQAWQKQTALQQELEVVRATAYRNQVAKEAAISSASAELSRLRNTIKNQSVRAVQAHATTGINGADSLCWDVLDESVSQYVSVAKDADELVERIRIGQDWARAISN